MFKKGFKLQNIEEKIVILEYDTLKEYMDMVNQQTIILQEDLKDEIFYVSKKEFNNEDYFIKRLQEEEIGKITISNIEFDIKAQDIRIKAQIILPLDFYQKEFNKILMQKITSDAKFLIIQKISSLKTVLDKKKEKVEDNLLYQAKIEYFKCKNNSYRRRNTGDRSHNLLSIVEKDTLEVSMKINNKDKDNDKLLLIENYDTSKKTIIDILQNKIRKSYINSFIILEPFRDNINEISNIYAVFIKIKEFKKKSNYDFNLEWNVNKLKDVDEADIKLRYGTKK